MPSREEAWKLLNEFTQSASLLKHALSVEACMRWYAAHLGKDAEAENYGITGLLHDFDYERWPDPTPEGHPFVGNKILAERGYSAEIREAIMGHANYSGVPRTSLLAKTLFAVDELSGLVTAAVLVRPDKSIFNLEAPSVLKKMKDKAFAKGCNRDDIRIGAEEIGLPLEQHVNNVITALRGIAGDIGLAGATAPAAGRDQ
jgi:predicted hydrolase (HD superfamily)